MFGGFLIQNAGTWITGHFENTGSRIPTYSMPQQLTAHKIMIVKYATISSERNSNKSFEINKEIQTKVSKQML